MLHVTDISNPEFEKAGKVHDWRNHVPQIIRDLWKTFTAEQKIALMTWAENLAELEHWE